MSTTDPIADMLTRIRNANRLGAEVVTMPGSKLKTALADALKREGFITDYQSSTSSDGPQTRLTVTLKYGPDGERVIQFIDRISTPGRRIYAGRQSMPRVLSGMGCAILSTNKGVLSDRECKNVGVGGEVICHVG